MKKENSLPWTRRENKTVNTVHNGTWAHSGPNPLGFHGSASPAVAELASRLSPPLLKIDAGSIHTVSHQAQSCQRGNFGTRLLKTSFAKFMMSWIWFIFFLSLFFPLPSSGSCPVPVCIRLDWRVKCLVSWNESTMGERWRGRRGLRVCFVVGEEWEVLEYCQKKNE